MQWKAAKDWLERTFDQVCQDHRGRLREARQLSRTHQPRYLLSGLLVYGDSHALRGQDR